MNITVNEGAAQMLSLSEPGPFAGAIVNVVPKHLEALKDLVGVNSPNKRINLRDEVRYRLADDVRELVELTLDGNTPIQDWTQDLLKAVLLSVRDTSEFPESVKLEQKIRRPICSEPMDFKPREGLWMAGPVVRARAVILPEWLRELQVFRRAFLVNNIVVGHNATLILGGPPMLLSADNLYIHKGGKVIQQTDSVTINLLGEIQGDLP